MMKIFSFFTILFLKNDLVFSFLISSHLTRFNCGDSHYRNRFLSHSIEVLTVPYSSSNSTVSISTDTINSAKDAEDKKREKELRKVLNKVMNKILWNEIKQSLTSKFKIKLSPSLLMLISFLQKKFFNRVFLFRSTVFLFALTLFKKYTTYVKSLTMEISYATFMKLLSDSPERIINLRVSPTAFQFYLDGHMSAFAKLIPVDNSILSKLISSGNYYSMLCS